ncbi:hypothetical protein OG423_32160 [Micromonospora zamorensis]|uniref:hypothetical protein n=1 Tax=Micromonospora zamorensis TaxID=709883 RepID=UPI00352B7C7F|nr:hypothetical protein OG423_32160 [Micromonospora zamorensis]
MAGTTYSDAVLAAELPKVTDWMQAWGSLLGVGVSTLAVVITGLLLRHELRARREDQGDAEAAQARLVVTGLGSFGVDDHGHVRQVDLRLENFSSGPIYTVYMELRDGEGNRQASLAGITREGDNVAYKRLVPPGDTFVETLFLPKATKMDHNELLMFAEVVIRFIDTAGFAWSKTGTGAPVRLRAAKEQGYRQRFWPLLWEYLWPLSTPASSIPRWIRSRARAARTAVMNHMGRRLDRRRHKRWRAEAKARGIKVGSAGETRVADEE